MIKNNLIKNTDDLQAEVRDRIGIIAFNRPEAKNALSDELTPELRRILIEFESLEKALQAYESPEYQEALKALDGGADRDFRIFEGL